jgi:hypothetical protein
MKPLTIKQIQTLRDTQAMWLRVTECPSIRLCARENAARHVAAIEAQIRAGASVPLAREAVDGIRVAGVRRG